MTTQSSLSIQAPLSLLERIDAFALPSFEPHWWGRNRHLQTVAGSLLRPVEAVDYQRERWETEDGDFLDIDFLHNDPDAPMVLVCHGLASCSRSRYILCLMQRLQEIGWNGVGMNYRGCSGEPNRLLRSYHSGETGDLGWVIERLAQRHPHQPLYLVGYSLGGNLVAKWLGEQGEAARGLVTAAFVCCTPFDLTRCQAYADSGIRQLYVRHFLKLLRVYVKRKAEQFPGQFDAERALRARTFREFDDAYTAPVHGFRGYQDYYEQASSKSKLKQVSVPLLVFNSLDDPLIPEDSLPGLEEVASQTRVAYFKYGGHVGFMFDRRTPHWLSFGIREWLMAFHDGAKQYASL